MQPLPTQPLSGQRVVICRAAADAAPLRQQLVRLGAEVLSVPLVEPIPPTDNGRSLDASVAELDRYDWLVTTSANGSRAVLNAMERVRVAATPKLACVGAVTASVFTEAGLVVSLQASVSSAAGLVAQFPEASTPERVLAPLARLASGQLEDGLRAKGYDVDRRDAYDTAPATVTDRQRTDISDASSILFTSSSTVDRFVDIVGLDLVPTVAVSIGPKTSSTMTRRGVAIAIEADVHNQEGVIEALCQVVSTMDR